jgi:hypothetical protein
MDRFPKNRRCTIPLATHDRRIRAFASICFGIAALHAGAAFAQHASPSSTLLALSRGGPIALRMRIPLPGVYGLIDHFGWDSKRGNLLVSALGNNTVEIVDEWKRVHSIPGLEHPQASVYLPGVDRIAVSSESGKLRFYDAESYALIKTLDFGPHADADNMRYDPVAKLLYVAYGTGNRGALATVDPVTMDRRDEVRLGSHPESFQLAADGRKIFVNLPDQEAIAAVDRQNRSAVKWQLPADCIDTGSNSTNSIARRRDIHPLFARANVFSDDRIGWVPDSRNGSPARGAAGE